MSIFYRAKSPFAHHLMIKTVKTNESHYSLPQVAALLGVNAASIGRWIDSGKLECSVGIDGTPIFTVQQLSDFADRYNVSMRFLENADRSIALNGTRRLTASQTK